MNIAPRWARCSPLETLRAPDAQFYFRAKIKLPEHSADRSVCPQRRKRTNIPPAPISSLACSEKKVDKQKQRKVMTVQSRFQYRIARAHQRRSTIDSAPGTSACGVKDRIRLFAPWQASSSRGSPESHCTTEARAIYARAQRWLLCFTADTAAAAVSPSLPRALFAGVFVARRRKQGTRDREDRAG